MRRTPSRSGFCLKTAKYTSTASPPGISCACLECKTTTSRSVPSSHCLTQRGLDSPQCGPCRHFCAHRSPARCCLNRPPAPAECACRQLRAGARPLCWAWAVPVHRRPGAAVACRRWLATAALGLQVHNACKQLTKGRRVWHDVHGSGTVGRQPGRVRRLRSTTLRGATDGGADVTANVRHFSVGHGRHSQGTSKCWTGG